MKKIVIAPDSFKGTLGSEQVCIGVGNAFSCVFPECAIHSVPVADGGEGSVEAFLSAIGGEKRTLSVTGPFGEKVSGFYGILPDGKTAVLEMAACAGLPLAQGRLNPELSTTYGVGELMLDAVRAGCNKIILGLGGSCTNDGGAGAAAAAGAKFTNENNESFVPTGATLGQVRDIDLSQLEKAFYGVEIVAMCDIDNPLYGPEGAAHVFGPQKGADDLMIDRLDKGLHMLSESVEKVLDKHISKISGAGAAGGMGFGMAAFFGAKLRPGIEAVLDAVAFDSLIEDADLVISGEGRLDSQSARGKVVAGVAKRTSAAGVPLIAIVGQIGDGYEKMYDLGLSAVFTINRKAQSLEESAPCAGENLRIAAENIARLLKTVEK